MVGFTIDSIKLFISWADLIGFDVGALNKKLKNIKSKKRKTNWFTVGFFKNFHIQYSESVGVYLSGSISNYYKGRKNNIEYSELQMAIEKLGNELGLNLHRAKLYRIDLALNILTDYPVEQYSHYLFSDLPRYKRLEQDDGVRFQTSSKTFSIYNKSAELENRGIASENLLRLEFRLLRNVSNFLGIKEMKVADLYDFENFLKLVKGFQGCYSKIKKATVPEGFSELQFISPTILKRYILLQGLEAIGGQAEYYRMIEQLSKEGKFKTANEKSRCRKLVTNLYQSAEIAIPHPFTEEIALKINAEVENILLTNYISDI